MDSVRATAAAHRAGQDGQSSSTATARPARRCAAVKTAACVVVWRLTRPRRARWLDHGSRSSSAREEERSICAAGCARALFGERHLLADARSSPLAQMGFLREVYAWSTTHRTRQPMDLAGATPLHAAPHRRRGARRARHDLISPLLPGAESIPSIHRARSVCRIESHRGKTLARLASARRAARSWSGSGRAAAPRALRRLMRVEPGALRRCSHREALDRAAILIAESTSVRAGRSSAALGEVGRSTRVLCDAGKKSRGRELSLPRRRRRRLLYDRVLAGPGWRARARWPGAEQRRRPLFATSSCARRAERDVIARVNHSSHSGEPLPRGPTSASIATSPGVLPGASSAAGRRARSTASCSSFPRQAA